MATNNAINNTLASPFVVGGTSVATSGTQFNYLHGLVAGSNGNIITSNGSAMTTSSPNSVGCVQLIATGTASNSATIDFTGLTSSYSYYYVVISNAQPVNNTDNLLFRVSTDNGSTYSATGYYYAATTQNSASGTGTNTAANSTNFRISFSQSNGGNDNGGGILEIINPSQTATYHQFLGNMTYVDSTGAIVTSVGGCLWVSTSAINAIRFLYNTGNINTGTFKLYGVLV